MSIVIFFDTETTGIPSYKEPSEAPHQPHIVQLAAHQYDLKSRKILQSMDVIVRPDGWEIPQVCTDVHGITTAHAAAVGIPEKLAVAMFLDLWGGRTRIAHNTTFDNRIIRIATKRFFGEEIINAWHEGEYECTGLLSKPIMQMLPKNRYGFKMPKLSEAYSYFTGKELQNAHQAIADVNACLDIYLAIKN